MATGGRVGTRERVHSYLDFSGSWDLWRFTVFLGQTVGVGCVCQLQIVYVQCESKNPPPEVFWHFFPKRLGICSPNFTRLWYVPIYAKVQIVRPPVRIVTGGLIKCSWCFSFLFNAKSPSSLGRSPSNFTIGIWFHFIMQVQKFGGSPPKKFGGQKHAKFRSILYNLTLWSRISQERLKTSKIGKLIDREQFLPRSIKKVRWTLVHK